MKPPTVPAPPSTQENGRPIRILVIGAFPDPRTHQERETDELVQCFGSWVEAIDPDTTAEQLMGPLCRLGLTLGHAFRLWEMLHGLPEQSQRVDSIRLITAGAFSRNELTSPERIRAYFARPDWPQILAAWRADPVTREIRHVAKRFDRPTPPPPPGRRETPSSDPIDKRPVPHRAIGDQLPRKLEKHAANIAAALEELASQPTVALTAESLAGAVRRRRSSAGANCPVHIVREALTYLGQRGLVAIDGSGFRYQPRPE